MEHNLSYLQGLSFQGHNLINYIYSKNTSQSINRFQNQQREYIQPNINYGSFVAPTNRLLLQSYNPSTIAEQGNSFVDESTDTSGILPELGDIIGDLV